MGARPAAPLRAAKWRRGAMRAASTGGLRSVHAALTIQNSPAEARTGKRGTVLAGCSKFPICHYSFDCGSMFIFLEVLEVTTSRLSY